MHKRVRKQTRSAPGQAAPGVLSGAILAPAASEWHLIAAPVR